MNLQELKQRRIDLGYSYQELSERSGIPLGTIQKVFGGITKAPRRETLLKLQRVLEEDSSRKASLPYTPAVHIPHMVKESQNAYHSIKKQGEYTLEDYYALPDDQRVELIDGVFYDMSAPSSLHQIINGNLLFQLLNFMRGRKGPCLPMISPVDVQLDCDNKTMVQPDVLILCDRSKLKERVVYGAPDFVIEVLSPSTRRKDMSVKMQKYMNAGVREYWMVDIRKQKVVAYDLEHAQIPVVYGFDEPVPVGIWNNECLVDFTEVRDLLIELFPALFKNDAAED